VERGARLSRPGVPGAPSLGERGNTRLRSAALQPRTWVPALVFLAALTVCLPTEVLAARGGEPEAVRAGRPIAGTRTLAGSDRRDAHGSLVRQDAADVVVAAAQRYVGLPYQLGREGPHIFDCSGLVFRAFADAGQLGHIGGSRRRAAGYQRWFQERGRFSAALSDARRGDLVMYDNGSHIGIYLGEGEVISAVLSGVTVHALHGLTVPVTGFLIVDWEDDREHVGGSDQPSPFEVPERPAELIQPLPWFSETEAQGEVVSPGVERTDMRTANSRTFEDTDGQMTTELFTHPVFYQPVDSADWHPIDLRFTADGEQEEVLRVLASPVTVELHSLRSETGFIHLTVPEHSIGLHLPPSTRARRATPLPELGWDRRYADYRRVLRGAIGLRVFPRVDGARLFLVLHERPRIAELGFMLDAPGTTLEVGPDGSLGLLGPDGTVIGRIPRPVALDSSDVDGSGGALDPSATTLSAIQTEGELPLLSLQLSEEYLSDAVYPVYVDLTISEFVSPAAYGAASTSSSHPHVALGALQRPEWPAHQELWHGRQPGTGDYGETYLRFADLFSSVHGVGVASAALHVYPYWQRAAAGRPTSVARVTSPWTHSDLTWNNRPQADIDEILFVTRAQSWASVDVTDYVLDVGAGRWPDHGLLLHANELGHRGWKRFVAEGFADEVGLGPRLVVRWFRWEPVPAGPREGAHSAILEWTVPAVAASATEFRIQVTDDDFESPLLRSGVVQAEPGHANQWRIPAGHLDAGGEYSWRVKVKLGQGDQWSDWSIPSDFVYQPHGSDAAQ
jgi:cell wall-associated NlpC family hydrolase